MLRVARFSSYVGLSLAISSFIGAMAQHFPFLAIGYWTLVLLLILGLITALLAGNVLDHYLALPQDTSLALVIVVIATFIAGGFIGWLILL